MKVRVVRLKILDEHALQIIPSNQVDRDLGGQVGRPECSLDQILDGAGAGPSKVDYLVCGAELLPQEIGPGILIRYADAVGRGPADRQHPGDTWLLDACEFGTAKPV